MRVNKRELRVILGCSPPTLDAWISQHGAAFPVLERGGNGRDWWFDSDAVIAFLDEYRNERDRLSAERDAAINQLALPLGHNGGPAGDLHDQPLKPHELVALAKLRKLQREEEYELGRLVKVSELRESIGSAVSLLRDQLAALPRKMGEREGWPDQAVEDLQREIENAQRAFISRLQRSAKCGRDQDELPLSAGDIDAAA